MKKIYLILGIILGVSVSSTAQVQINVQEENEELSADFQLDANNKGVVLPRIALTSTLVNLPVATPKEGVMIYNTVTTGDVTPGYYYWKLEPVPHWESMGLNTLNTIIQLVNPDILGYNPTESGSNADNTISVEANTAAKQRCQKWEKAAGGNGHTYCVYTVNNGINFANAFDLAQNQNGYVLTVTSQSEWDFVLNNIINDNAGLGGSILDQNIWLGYVKVRRPGNNNYVNKYEFITGEVWDVSWSNSAVAQAQFALDEPQDANLNNTSRCTFISSLATNASRQWGSSLCSTTTGFTHLIIEFTE